MPIIKKSSVEHIIPRRLFYNKQNANNIFNLAFCDSLTNSKRSDYKFGDYETIDMYYVQQKLIIPIKDTESKLINGFVDSHKRIYYPYKYADFGLISRSILYMLYTYPELYSNLNEIITDPAILEKWNKFPILDYELKRKQKVFVS
jgi:endonuclease I